jgi:hypothetical protein
MPGGEGVGAVTAVEQGGAAGGGSALKGDEHDIVAAVAEELAAGHAQHNHMVATVAAVDQVDAGASVQAVVSRAAVDRVVAESAVQAVVARGA